MRNLLPENRSGHFLQRRRRLIVWALPCLALLAALAAWGVFLHNLQTREAAVIRDTRLRVDAFAKNYVERLDRTIDVFDRILLHVRYDWDISEGRTRLEGATAAGVFPGDAVVAVVIFDENGRALTSSLPLATEISVADREYFQFHKNIRQDQLLIGRPIRGRLSGKEIILFSRRLYSETGDFKGIAVASIRPEYLTANYSEAALGKHGYLGVLGVDKQIRVARIGGTVSILQGETPATTFFPDAESEQGINQLDGATWFADKRNRFVAWRKVKDTQLIAMVGLDEEEALAPFHAGRRAALENAYWNTLGLLIFTIMATAFAHVVLRKKSELDSARIAYRAATEEGVDGFYINRPLRDKTGRIFDYLVVDCNQRGAELFKLKRHELIGSTISHFYGADIRTMVFRRLQEAFENGIHESEIKVNRKDRLDAEWIHYKAVRSGDDLAVTIRDISENKAHVNELERQGNEDALTGLPNRHWIQTYLPEAIEKARASGLTMALLFVDIDRFKHVNDALGHAAGDELLRLIASRLTSAVRPHDHVVRLGGDEYVILVEHAGTDADIERLTTRVLEIFQERFRISDEEHAITASIGVSVYPRDGNDAATLLKNADIAMYAVKKNGKDNYQFYRPHFYESLKSRLAQEVELRRAIEADEFEMYYQPCVHIADACISKMEALVRWNHPARGLVSPTEFIPLAEETGLIVPLGELVINKVCQQLSLWAGMEKRLIPVSINVSPKQVYDSDILSILAGAMQRHDISPQWIQIEITESVMMQRSFDDMRLFASLREMGIHLCLDDFGTGYSSLSQLQELDFDVLKIDRSFTMRVHKDEGKILVGAMITMAHALGMKVVAEGVETEYQMNLLRDLKCDEAQGFFTSRPIPPGQMSAFFDMPAAHSQRA